MFYIPSEVLTELQYEFNASKRNQKLSRLLHSFTYQFCWKPFLHSKSLLFKMTDICAPTFPEVFASQLPLLPRVRLPLHLSSRDPESSSLLFCFCFFFLILAFTFWNLFVSFLTDSTQCQRQHKKKFEKKFSKKKSQLII